MVGIIIAVLLQFGLIGKDAEKEALKQQENYFEIKSQIAELQISIRSLEATIIKNTSNQWTAHEMELFATQLQRDNASVKVPDVRRIKGR